MPIDERLNQLVRDDLASGEPILLKAAFFRMVRMPTEEFFPLFSECTQDERLLGEERVKKALGNGADSMQELLSQAYSDVPPDMWQFAEATLRAHLERLGVPQFE